MTTFQSIREFRFFMAKILHRFLAQKVLVCLVIALRLTVTFSSARGDDAANYRVKLTIDSPLTLANTPIDPEIDFTALIRQLGVPGVLDPQSIRVINLKSDNIVPHTLSETCSYGDRGRVGWVVEDPAHVGTHGEQAQWRSAVSRGNRGGGLCVRCTPGQSNSSAARIAARAGIRRRSSDLAG